LLSRVFREEGTHMSRTMTRRLLGAALAIAAGGILAVPAAHADSSCAVEGEHLNLHHSSGYDVTLDASGASLGPGAVIRVAPGLASDGNVSGGIDGRTIDFRISWYGTKSYVYFTGTVGGDGIAHGTSTAITDPVGLNEGPWDSVDSLACS
jgi:hypothetical protein